MSKEQWKLENRSNSVLGVGETVSDSFGHFGYDSSQRVYTCLSIVSSLAQCGHGVGDSMLSRTFVYIFPALLQVEFCGLIRLGCWLASHGRTGLRHYPLPASFAYGAACLNFNYV